MRITTGFVEPHFFAGFSGGPKLVAPGLAGLETVLTLHDAARIGDPRATWGDHRGQPGARRRPRDRRGDRRATSRSTSCSTASSGSSQAFGGELLADARRRLRPLAARLAMRPVPAPFDVVVTTNAGFPLDQNLYQAVKGMSAAATVVEPGGTIVCAAECRDGFPDHGSYREVLASAASPRGAARRRSRARDRDRARPVAGADPGQGPGARPGGGAHLVPRPPTTCAAAHLEHTEDIAADGRRRAARGRPRRAGLRAARGPADDPLRRGRRRARRVSDWQRPVDGPSGLGTLPGFARLDLTAARRARGCPRSSTARARRAARSPAIVAALLDRNAGPVLVTRVEPGAAAEVAAR